MHLQTTHRTAPHAHLECRRVAGGQAVLLQQVDTRAVVVAGIVHIRTLQQCRQVSTARLARWACMGVRLGLQVPAGSERGHCRLLAKLLACNAVCADLLARRCACLAPRRHMRGEEQRAAAAGVGRQGLGAAWRRPRASFRRRRGRPDTASLWDGTDPPSSQLQTYLSWLLPRSRAAAWWRPPRGAGCPPRPRPLECFLLSRHLLRAASFSLKSIGTAVHLLVRSAMLLGSTQRLDADHAFDERRDRPLDHLAFA